MRSSSRFATLEGCPIQIGVPRTKISAKSMRSPIRGHASLRSHLASAWKNVFGSRPDRLLLL